MRHARGTTIGEVENQMVTKLVMNTADALQRAPARTTVFGQRVVRFVTGSVVIGLATTPRRMRSRSFVSTSPFSRRCFTATR
jgi:hypothetical protein